MTQRFEMKRFSHPNLAIRTGEKFLLILHAVERNACNEQNPVSSRLNVS